MDSVDRTLQLFKGNEREMWGLLREKYPKAFKAEKRMRKVHPEGDLEGGGGDGNGEQLPSSGTRLDLDDLGGEVRAGSVCHTLAHVCCFP